MQENGMYKSGMYAGLNATQVLDQLAAHLALFFPSIKEAPEVGRENINAAQYEAIKAAAEKWHAETGAPVARNGKNEAGGIAKELDSIRRFHGCPGIPYRRAMAGRGAPALPGFEDGDGDGETGGVEAIAREIKALREEVGTRLGRLEGLLGDGLEVFRRLLDVWEGGGGEGVEKVAHPAAGPQDGDGEAGKEA